MSTQQPATLEQMCVILLRAKCSTCPAGHVIEPMAFYATHSLPQPSPGEPLPLETKTKLREMLSTTCRSRGCAPNRCVFESVQWDPALDQELTAMYQALTWGFMPEAKAQELMNSFIRERQPVAIEELASHMKTAHLAGKTKQAAERLEALWEKEAYSIT